MAAAGEELYTQREQRFNDIVALKKPDRVPVIGHTYPLLRRPVEGLLQREAGYDHEQHYAAIRDATVEFGWDFVPTNGCSPPTATKPWASSSCAGRAATCPTTRRSSSSRAST